MIFKYLAHITIFLFSIQIGNAQDVMQQINCDNYSKRVITAVNNYRHKKGLSLMQESATMTFLAKNHSKNMAEKKLRFGHKNFNKRVKIIYETLHHPNGASENIAYFPRSRSPEQVVAMWLTSTMHRHNIEGNYNLTGVGVEVDNRGWVYYTQEFAMDLK